MWESVMGVSNTVHRMLSKHGGVVRDPSYLKKLERFSGSMERTFKVEIFIDCPEKKDQTEEGKAYKWEIY